MIHKTAIPICVICVLSGCGSRNDDSHVVVRDEKPSRAHVTPTQTTIHELLGQAIDTLGGNAALERLKTCRITYRDRSEVPAWAGKAGDAFKGVVIEDYFKYPDKLHRTVTRASDGVALFVSVVNGQNTWTREPGKAVVSLSQAVGRDAAWPPEFQRLYSLSEWREKNEGNLSVGDAETIDGQRCDCIVVMSAGKPIGRVYLDPLTHYVKKDLKYNFPDYSNPPTSLNHLATVETTSSDYKNFDGVIVATHVVVVQGGRKLSETELLHIEFLKTIDEHLFDKPLIQ